MNESHDIDIAYDSRDLLGEGPIWDDRSGRILWTDIQSDLYHVLEPTTGSHRALQTGTPVGVIALREAGGIALATKDGFAVHDPDSTDPLEFLGNPEAEWDDTRFNDGAVDPSGRFWAGTYGRDENHLYRLDADRSIHRMGSGYGVPNGIGWSLDGRTMYFTDSDARTIYAFDYDDASGTVENRRTFVDSTDDDGVPDGLAVDAEGFVWSARFDGWRIERYDPDGRLERTVRMPVQRPTSMAFGGADLGILYVSSARKELDDEDLREQPHAGSLFRLEPGVKGRPENRYRG